MSDYISKSPKLIPIDQSKLNKPNLINPIHRCASLILSTLEAWHDETGHASMFVFSMFTSFAKQLAGVLSVTFFSVLSN